MLLPLLFLTTNCDLIFSGLKVGNSKHVTYKHLDSRIKFVILAMSGFSWLHTLFPFLNFNSLMISTFSLLGLSAKQSSQSINIWLVLACYPTYDRLISSCRQILLHDAKVAQWDFPWVTRGIFPGHAWDFPWVHVKGNDSKNVWNFQCVSISSASSKRRRVFKQARQL